MKSCHGCPALQIKSDMPIRFCPLGFEVKAIITEYRRVKFPLEDCDRPRTINEAYEILERSNA
jgi:hypothetical protein